MAGHLVKVVWVQLGVQRQRHASAGDILGDRTVPLRVAERVSVVPEQVCRRVVHGTLDADRGERLSQGFAEFRSSEQYDREVARAGRVNIRPILCANCSRSPRFTSSPYCGAAGGTRR